MNFCKDCGSKLNKGKCPICNKNDIVGKSFTFGDLGKGGKTTITVYKDYLTLKRPGVLSKFSHGFVGEKTIKFNQISSVELKKAGFARGFIRFVVIGSLNSGKAGIAFGNIDENIVYFSSKINNNNQNDFAEKLKNYIDNYNASSSNQINVIKEDDKYDKLTKIKKLFDDGVLSEEEYKAEKQKIINEELL